jgi:hypothetical protein
VAFDVTGPWTRPRALPRPTPVADFVLQTLFGIGALGMLAFAAVAARHNVQTNRADRRGAARLVGYVMIAGFTGWALAAHHMLDVDAIFDSVFRTCGPLALFAGLLWVIYIAVEPYVRRVSPDSLLGWSRLLAGHVRDPRVGRDTFIGLIAGVLLAYGDLTRAVVLPWLGYPAPRPSFGLQVDLLSSGVSWLARWLSASIFDTMQALFTVLMLVVLRLVLRRDWLVWPVLALVLAVLSMRYMGSTTNWIVLWPLASGAALTFVVIRFGLLSLVVAQIVWGLLLAAPLTLNVGHWSATASNATLALLIGLALFAFYASRGGQPLLGSLVRE